MKHLFLVAVCFCAFAPTASADPPADASKAEPNQLPAKASLKDVEKRFANRQRGSMFCIPCGIESALKYYDINDYTQEQLVLKWVKSGGKLRGRNGFLNTNGADDDTIKTAARGAILWGANFRNFKQVAESVVPLKDLGYEFEFAVVKNLDEYSKRLKHAIANDHAFIMSLNLGGGAHIVNVVAYDGDKVTLWEPQAGKMHTKTLAEFRPNLDLLILRPVQKKGDAKVSEKCCQLIAVS